MGALQYYLHFTPYFPHRGNCLFDILTSTSFDWSEKQESCLHTNAVLQTYSPSVHSALITDTLPVGIGAVLEQKNRLVTSVSHTIVKQGY